MAFPVIAETKTSVNNSNVQNHVVDMPTTVDAGDLLLTFLVIDSGFRSTTFPEGWTEIADSNSTQQVSIGYRVADGTEGETSITVTTSNFERSAHVVYRITGHDSSSNPPEVSAFANGTSTAPDSASLTAGGGSKEYLWISVEGNDAGETVSVYPTNYALSQVNVASTGAGNCAIGVAGRNLNTDAEDPGAFTISSSEEWGTYTVCVYPAAAVTLSVSASECE